MSNFFKGFKEGFALFGANVAAIINTVLLSLAYIIAVGITALVARIAGKQFLDMKKQKTTYWKDVAQRQEKMEESFRQF